MIAWSVGASSLAHGVHYGVLVIGLLGLLALLGPQWVGAPPAQPRDEHERRVADLHRQIASGSLGTTTLVAPRSQVVPFSPATVLLPVVVVSSAAAAGIHAAIGPVHLGTLPLFGVFFLGCAVAQLAWSVAMVHRPSRSLLRAAVLGNAALLLLWVTSRTVGLPFGLLPTAEPVGAWDLTCACWELAVALGGTRLLRSAEPTRLALPAYDAWPSSARLWLYGSVLVLAALTLSGAGA